jgi:hypothetical protein
VERGICASTEPKYRFSKTTVWKDVRNHFRIDGKFLEWLAGENNITALVLTLL